MEQLTKAPKTGLRFVTGGMKTTPISGVERTAGLLSLEERGEENLLCQSEKKRLPSHPLHFKLEAPTKKKKKKKKQTQETRVQITWSKHFSRNTGSPHQHVTTGNASKPWGLASRCPINILGIQAKEHHTDGELRSLILEAVSVAYPSITWARADTDGSAEEAAKKWQRWSSHQAPRWQIHQEVWLQGSGQQTTEQKPMPCLQQPRPWTRKRAFLPTQCSWLTASPSCSLQLPGGDRIFSNIKQELSLPKNRTSVTLQWISSHCGVQGKEEADWLSKI